MNTFRLVVEIIGGVGVIGGATAWFVRSIIRLNNGMKALLRTDMMKTYYKHRGEDKLREYEKKNFLLEFEAYKALGGNSFIDDISKDVRSWDVIP